MINLTDILPFLFTESKRFWLTSGNKDDHVITSRSDYSPNLYKQDYANKLAKYLNRVCHLYGGAVLVGYKDETFTEELYIVVLDDQGLARTAIDFPKPFNEVEKWRFDTFQWQVEQSIAECIDVASNAEYKMKYWGDLTQNDFK